MKHALAVLVLLVATTPARAADERPPPLPTRDVEMKAVLETTSGAGQHVSANLKISFNAARQRMRVEQQGKPGYMILDPKHAQTFVVMTARHSYQEQPFRPLAHAMFILADAFSYNALTPDTVAGQPCQTWDMRSPTIAGTVCVTSDGVVLKVDTADADGDGDDVALKLIASNVTYASQPAANFAPPSGYKKVKAAAEKDDD
jgi:hypothetical protein